MVLMVLMVYLLVVVLGTGRKISPCFRGACVFVKPQSFGNGLRSVAAFRATTFAGTASRGDLWLHTPGSTSSMGYIRILLHRRDRTHPPFQDEWAADRWGAVPQIPARIAVHCRSPTTSLVTPSKGCACLALGGAPSRHMTVVASEVSWRLRAPNEG
eukprot:COSAG01_NODE_9354_length_2472_cov_1.749263_1_plen_156_part_10